MLEKKLQFFIPPCSLSIHYTIIFKNFLIGKSIKRSIRSARTTVRGSINLVLLRRNPILLKMQDTLPLTAALTTVPNPVKKITTLPRIIKFMMVQTGVKEQKDSRFSDKYRYTIHTARLCAMRRIR